MITEVFAPHEPTTVHESRTPDELAEILIDFKPKLDPSSDRTTTPAETYIDDRER